jgi:flagellum-specific peptidoglycan hydrolase FlgJ
MQSTRKARWQQATALLSLSTAGAMTGLSFAHGTVADLTAPTRMPVKLAALNKPAGSPAASDGALRSAIVRAAQYYLRLAQNRSPSEMEALIWQNDSTDGADHGESCAAFASLTLESAAQATGQQSWVTGGTTYPWPVHSWVDSRVDPNAQSPDVISVLQDAQAHHRWHPLGDGYTPSPGDWVLFDGHVEVVTNYAGGVLYTIGGDSMPNLSVNAHQYNAPLAGQGVTGFVNNGVLLTAVSQSAPAMQDLATAAAPSPQGDLVPAHGQPGQAQADIPGMGLPGLSQTGTAQAGSQPTQPDSAGSGASDSAAAGTATIPGALAVTGSVTTYSSAGAGAVTSAPAASSPRYSRSQVAASAASVPESVAQQAFINEVVPGALAAQRQYGIPASVTIAQAIDESGWGQSELATQEHNLFGIKGTGPAGSVLRPTQEYQNGQQVSVNAPFRAYSSVAQSISDHTLLLATGSSYKQAMADRRSPDAFANDLTGIYATDPNYGANLITIMRQHNLYRFDAATSTARGAETRTRAAHNAGGPGAAGQNSPSQSAAALGSLGQSGLAQTGLAQAGSGPGGAQAGTGPGGAQAGTGPGGAQAGTGPGRAQAGTGGQGAMIPGAVAVNPAALGLTAPHATGRGQMSRGASGPGAATHGTAGRQGTPARRAPAASDAVGSGEASIPGLDSHAGTAAGSSPTTDTSSAHLQPSGGQALRAGPRNARVSTRRYVAQMPRIVTTDFIATAKTPLLRAKPLYQDVAAHSGLRWELLAACDWMQCQAQPRMSPVHGEKLGTRNADGTVYRTKSEALEQVAADLIELAAAVYGINLRQRLILSIRDLANVFAAFRWGGLLKAHCISAMEFPYSVEGLTTQHLKMRWPDVGEGAPDKPGARFRKSFGAVPVVLGLSYPAIA